MRVTKIHNYFAIYFLLFFTFSFSLPLINYLNIFKCDHITRSLIKNCTLACNIAGKYATFMLNRPKQGRTIFFSLSLALYFSLFFFKYFHILAGVLEFIFFFCAIKIPNYNLYSIEWKKWAEKKKYEATELRS